MARSRRLFVAAALASLLLVAACNSLLGLDDFSKTECSGGSCGDGSVLPDVLSGDTGATDAGDETTGTTPAVWAQWPMPNYDAGSANLPNPIAYTTGAFITDMVTGLTWQTQSFGDLTYAAAEAKCASITESGPWRLPKRIELVSLLDFGKAKGAAYLDPRFGVAKVKVWTSSQQKPLNADAPSYWVVDFETGIVGVSPSTSQDVHSALCVKGK